MSKVAIPQAVSVQTAVNRLMRTVERSTRDFSAGLDHQLEHQADRRKLYGWVESSRRGRGGHLLQAAITAALACAPHIQVFEQVSLPVRTPSGEPSRMIIDCLIIDRDEGSLTGLEITSQIGTRTALEWEDRVFRLGEQVARLAEAQALRPGLPPVIVVTTQAPEDVDGRLAVPVLPLRRLSAHFDVTAGWAISSAQRLFNQETERKLDDVGL